MFRQKEYQFFELAQKQIQEYVIQPGDQMSLQVLSRDGFRLIDVLGGGAGSAGVNGGLSYLVDYEGFVKLPVLGEFYVAGYTESELKRIFAEKFSNLFVDPFVLLNVSNRRVFVFKGSSGTIVPLNPAPTNLFEVIAKAGGISGDLKSYNIKIIRGDLKNPQVHVVDVSTLEGMRKADLIVQSNDIIYIEPRRQVLLDAFGSLTPYLTLITTILTSVVLIEAYR